MFSIICVTWKNQKLAQECVDSICKNSWFTGHEIIVVHNEYDAYSGKEIDGAINLFNKYNVGLSKAANDGAKLATKQYICLIDDDITVTKDWDTILFSAIDNIPSTNWVASTRIEPIAPHYNISTKDWENGKRPSTWYKNISNTPLLMYRSFWQLIGGYDESFPNIGAELGLAKKAYDAGERDFVQTPKSIVFHKQSQSMKKISNSEAKKLRKERDVTFLKKYGIPRKKFTKLIGKGLAYEK